MNRFIQCHDYDKLKIVFYHGATSIDTFKWLCSGKCQTHMSALPVKNSKTHVEPKRELRPGCTKVILLDGDPVLNQTS